MKNKTIGNAFFLLIAGAWNLVAADPQLQVRVIDVNGSVIEQVAAGQPFMVEVVATQVPRGMSQPAIANIAQYNGYCSGVQMTTINGRSSNTYTYMLRIDNPGNYQIGPISVVYDGKKKEIDPLPLVVATETKQQQTVAKIVNATKGQYSALLQLQLEKDRVYVGEPVGVKLRFLYNSPHMELRSINEPQLKQVSIDHVAGPVAGKQVINGITYEYVEWSWRLHPTKEGVLTVPAYGAQYEIVNPHANQQSVMNFFMFFQPNPVKGVYSNAATLVVDPVPEHQGELVDGVGHFTGFRAEVNPAVIKVGQAAVMTFSLEGDAHFATVEPPVLESMPNGVRWYASKNWLDQYADGTGAKHFEYVLHACQEGDWEIPSQIFTFFDPHMRQYGRMESTPQYITIIKDPTAHISTAQKNSQQSTGQPDQSSQNNPSVQTEYEDASDALNDSSVLMPLRQSTLHAAHLGYTMPWWLFWLLVGIPFVIQCCMSSAAANSIKQVRTRLRKKYAFYSARKALRAAQAAHKPGRVYAIFATLCSKRLDIPLTEISHEGMEDMLVQYIPLIKRDAWKQSIHQFALLSYTEVYRQNDLFWHDAHAWLDELEKGGL